MRKPPRIRRKSYGSFDFAAKRRREIVLLARHVGAADTEDFSRWLIAWVWHNRKAQDQIWSVMNAARSMGGKVTEAEASPVTEEASITRRHLSADNLAKFLGVTYAQRQALHLTTIGSVNVKRGARRELRKLRDLRAKERLRRARGMRPQSQSLSATKPWEQMGMSRARWYRHGKPETAPNEARETTLSTPIFLIEEDRPVSPERQGCPSGATPRRKQGDFRLATATMIAYDGYGSLPLELRSAALGLPYSELRAAA
jgi:hypothetical protein